MNVNITVILGACVGAVVGAVIGFAGTILSTLIARKAEERRHFRELGVQVALAKFGHVRDTMQEVAKASRRIVEMPSLDAFLVQGIKLMDAVSDSRLSAEQIAGKITESVELAKGVSQALKRQPKSD